MTSGTIDYLSVGEFYPNQDYIVKTLRSEGYDVSVRTLRYWRHIGSLPELIKMGTQWCYPESMLKNIRYLCEEAHRYIGEILFTKVLEGESFNVFEVTVNKPDDKYQVIYKTDKGLLIERKSNLDGIYR